jgi:flagellar protein FlbD
MVEVTALSGQKMVINEALIERIEAKPDTIVSLTSGRKLIVRESVRELLQLLTDCRRAMVMDAFAWPLMNMEPSHILTPEIV